MATYRTTILSTRAPAEVFAYMARFSNARAWDPGVSGAEELHPGPPSGAPLPLLRPSSSTLPAPRRPGR
jgi:hypothetical protein